jgi:hypothetical protein
MNLFDEISSRPSLHARHEAAILLRPRIRQVAAADNIEYVNEVPGLGHCVRFGAAVVSFAISVRPSSLLG